MKCKICGRTLRSEKSRAAGYGPVCYRKSFGISPPIKCKRHISSDSITHCKVPGQMEVFDYLQIIGAI